MLTMSEINSIKFLRNHKSLSINKIANTFGINWRTAKKYDDCDQIPQEKIIKKRGMMYEEKLGEIVFRLVNGGAEIKAKTKTNEKENI
ncbi:hypothetical protein [Aeribacillus pallidus]|uniref:hypothetical protein n=1 Tax=Aeribacillus pallidus TaxID=33936 RepID=UPI003D243677